MTSRRRSSVITSEPNKVTSPQVILSELMTAGADLAQGRNGAREQLLNLSHALIASLETPDEAVMRFGRGEPARTALCRIAVDLNIFSHLRDSGRAGCTARDLSYITRADAAFLSRMMKHLAATNVISEIGPDRYAATALSSALAEDRYADGLAYQFDLAIPSFNKLPSFAKARGYVAPTTLTDSPFQAALGTELSFFDWLAKNPEHAAMFSNYMAGTRVATHHWAEGGYYPICDRLVKGFDAGSSDVFLVDVGGGTGYDLRMLREKAPQIPGKLVLQDKKELVEGMSGDQRRGIDVVMAHDCFDPQPVVGARAYYLHSALHIWGDEDCVRILEQLKHGVKRGYSRVLINEIVVPTTGALWPVTSMDQLVMVLGGMKERTEGDWAEILGKAGYRIVKVYTCEMGTDSLIEAELI